MAAGFTMPPQDPELVAGVEAAIGAGDPAALVTALLTHRSGDHWSRRYTPMPVVVMLRDMPDALRTAAVQDLTDRARGRTAADLDLLGTVLDEIVRDGHPDRLGLLADFQLSVLEPASLRAPVREALLADAEALRANHYRVPRGAASASASLVGRLNDIERRAVARWVMVFGRGPGSADYALSHSRNDTLGGSLAKRRLNWTAEETADLLDAARHGRYSTHPEVASIDALQGNELRFALPAAEQLSDADLRILLPALRTIVADLDEGRLGITRMGETAPRRLRALLERLAPQPAAATLPSGFFGETDDFGARARTELADVLGDPAAVPLLRHCTSVTSVRATATWQRQCRELGGEYPQATETLVRVLHLVLATKVVRTDSYVLNFSYAFLTPDNAAFVRGAVWAYSTLAGPEAAPLLGDVAVRCGRKHLSLPGSMIDGPVANSAVAALGSLDGAGALDQLRRVRDVAEHRTFQKSVASALDAAALRSGLSREQIIERGVPDHGVDGSGRFSVAIGPEGVATIVVDADGSAALAYTVSGAVVRSLPAALRDAHAEEIKELKSRLKEVQGTLRSERDRIEAILATERTWPAGDWVRYYLEHPLVGAHARRLIWEVASGPDGPWIAGLPEAVPDDVAGSPGGWRLRASDGAEHAVPADAVVRLWHPVRASVAAIEAWRESLTDAAYRQPFKQAFRELYLLTPAEEATETYSNRFAGHILRYGQAKALTAVRGWGGLNLGDWSSGMSGEAVHEFPGMPWRARFFLETAATGPHGIAELCATDQVRFERRAGRAWQPARLADVPAAVLSEGFRDVDLFVGIASIGADPRWTDRSDARHAAYWHEFSFGAVPASAAARRGTLARLLPRTRIADRVEVGDRFLRVRGDLRTYKIHLGSGNILMEPDDSYLCIVDARSKDAGRLFLPFEEHGGVLSLIVSKAFLLADDRKITDPGILRQIGRREAR